MVTYKILVTRAGHKLKTGHKTWSQHGHTSLISFGIIQPAITKCLFKSAENFEFPAKIDFLSTLWVKKKSEMENSGQIYHLNMRFFGLTHSICLT